MRNLTEGTKMNVDRVAVSLAETIRNGRDLILQNIAESESHIGSVEDQGETYCVCRCVSHL